MTGKRHKAAAWTVLVLLVLAGLGAYAFLGEAPARHAESEPARNVRVKVAPGQVRVGTTTLTVSAEDGEGNATDAWKGLADAWIVRDDLTYVTHLETAIDAATSSFSVPYLAGEPGSFRLAAIARDGGSTVVGGGSFEVAGRTADIAPEEQSAAREGYKVTLSTIPDGEQLRAGEPASFTYAVERTGTPVRLEEYRGGRGALIALKEGAGLFATGLAMDVALQPSPSATSFNISFPEPGRYRVFCEFQAAGKRYIEARWVDVLPAE